MKGGLFIALIGLLTFAPRPGHGQRLETFWQVPSAEVGSMTWRWPADSSDQPRTHRLEGAIIGGAVVGFLGAVTGLGLCHFDDPCDSPAPFVIGGFALGALAGVGLGGYIGAAYPKR